MQDVSMRMWVLSDGKPGHVNQSLGLAHALLRRGEGELHVVDLAGQGFFQKLRTVVMQRDIGVFSPDVIISAGHGTHVPLLWAAWRYKAISVVCMKPSFPTGMFDVCVIPRHDMDGEGNGAGKNVIVTVGAMHGIRPNPNNSHRHTLVLIGGASKGYGWDGERLKSVLLDSIEPNTEGEIVLTSSRRTPPEFVVDLTKCETSIKIVPVEQTYQGWVAEHLAEAKAVWVTEDSVSMVYESLGSGCPVGIIPMPRNDAKPSRVAYGLSLLLKEKRVTSLDEWNNTHQFHEQESPLLEADRVADCIVNRFPQLTRS